MSVDAAHEKPSNRVGHCMTSVGEMLIIYGGRPCLSTTLFNELWIYSTVSDSWRRYPTPIENQNTVVSSSICAYGNFVYIFGGAHLSHDVQSTNSLLSFDIGNATWKIVSPHIADHDQNTPPPMYVSLISYYNGSIYVLGGVQDLVNTDSIYKFCLKSSTWSLVPQNGLNPILRYPIFGTVYRHQFYIFGDCLAAGINRFRDVKVYDFSMNTWTVKATFSKTEQFPSDNRVHASMAFSKHFGYLSGGMISGRYNSDVWRIDLGTLEWFKLDYSLETGLGIHCMSVIYDSYLYIFGGDSNNSDPVITLERFTVRIPTLFRKCWESINRSPSLRRLAATLPTSIINELDLCNHDST
ncbi:Kelch domain-containing protein 10 [Thelohanellus kitauei]|uniref:Kelch domain-containing protein 10 n=1 Tax=Thelohanellus kitauei TaxID=669202 RepID=A0A0C2JAI1_THEKT|nr:Kelch domain-containing protein 10 [Thelohanellus kitauei]